MYLHGYPCYPPKLYSQLPEGHLVPTVGKACLLPGRQRILTKEKGWQPFGRYSKDISPKKVCTLSQAYFYFSCRAWKLILVDLLSQIPDSRIFLS